MNINIKETKRGGVNMNFLIRRFYINEPLETSGLVIKWWESKRLFFNISNIISFIVGLMVIYIFNPGLVNFFLLPFILAYGILINVVYLIGWIVLAIIKKTWMKVNITVYSSVMLIIFFVSSFFITLSLCVGYLLINIQ
jgi:hypothetical protein